MAAMFFFSNQDELRIFFLLESNLPMVFLVLLSTKGMFLVLIIKLSITSTARANCVTG
jgi:hypothetical protein